MTATLPQHRLRIPYSTSPVIVRRCPCGRTGDGKPYPYRNCTHLCWQIDQCGRCVWTAKEAVQIVRQMGADAERAAQQRGQQAAHRLWDTWIETLATEARREAAARRTVGDLLRLEGGRRAVRNLGDRRYSAATDALARRAVVREATAILAVRDERRAAHQAAAAARHGEPGRILRLGRERAAQRRAELLERTRLAVLYAANYRTATNGHGDVVAFCDGGQLPAAISDTGTDWNVYKGSFKGWAATTSEHTYRVRDTWLEAVEARGLAVCDGLLTLDAEPIRGHGPELFAATWVEQGRGTSIHTVRGYLARQGDTTYHAPSARAALDGLARKLGQKPPRRKGTLDLDRLARRHGDLPVYLADSEAVGNCHSGTVSWCRAVGIDPNGSATVADVVAGYKLRPLPEVIAVLRRVVRSHRQPVAANASGLEYEGRVIFDSEGGFRIERDN